MGDLTGVIDISRAAELFVAFLAAVLVGASNSTFGVFLTGLLRRFLPNVDPRKLSGLVAVGLTALVWSATATGRGEQLNSLFEWLMAVAPPTLALLTTFTSQSVLHEKAHAAGVPIAGYKVPKDHYAVESVSEPPPPMSYNPDSIPF